MARKKMVTTSRKQKRKKTNKKDIVKMLIPLGAAIVFIYVLYRIIKLIIVPTDMFMIVNDTIFNEESTVGYVIRDEKVAEGSASNGIVQIKAEGEKVTKGSQIFRYASQSEEEIKLKIDELNNKIQEAILGQKDLFPTDIKAIDNQIETKIEGLKNKNDLQEIEEYKNDINTYLTKKSKIAGELSQSGSYINDLIDEREVYENKLEENSEYVVAPISGVVSYRVDNLEETLTPNNFENLNEQMLENLDLHTGQIVTTSSRQGKVINNYRCYIATILGSKEAKEAKTGEKVTLRLSTQEEVPAKIEYISEQQNKDVLIVFEINKCVEKLIDYRKITFDVIWWRYEGLKVPKSAVYYNNGLSCVVRNRGGYQNNILVEVLRENDNYCIIDNYSNEELKNLGFTTQDISYMKKISIYDEIVLNPEPKQILQ